jgi:hypothetical protein
MQVDSLPNNVRIAYLTEYDPIKIIESLPKTVFPIKMAVEYPLTSETDSIDNTHSTPEYPVDIQVPHTPYIPETTIYFDNPASRPPANQKPWTRSEFLDKFKDQLSYISEQRFDEVQPRVTSITTIEIPYAYLTTDTETGNPVAKPELYEDEAEIAITEFARDASIRATEIKSEINDSLPGQAQSPMRLTKLIEATAKKSRYTDGTQQNPGRARYYTTSEAEKSGELSRTPAVYAPDTKVNTDARPLSPYMDKLEQFIPVFLRTCEPDIINRAKLTGQEREKTTFHANDIIK